MTRNHLFQALTALSLTAVAASGDTLVLRDGKEMDGTFVGATARQVEFLPSSGKTIKVSIDQIDSLNFSTPPVSAPKPPPQPAAGAAVIIKTGTAVRVRTIDPIDVDVTKAGTRFRAAIDDPIMVGGNVVVPRGADVALIVSKVEQGGRMKGSDLVQLKMYSIVVKGHAYPVVTSISETKSSGEGKKSARKIVGGAGLGAIVGGIAGGGKGAGIGALVGGAGGTAIAASGQPHLKVPPETRLDFELKADLKVQ